MACDEVREVSIDTFIAEKLEELKAFEAHWREASRRNGEHFPLEMPAGNWDESLWLYDGKAFDVEEPERDPEV